MATRPSLRPDIYPTSQIVPERRRGRPKGTGIDDTGQLAGLRALLASDTALKPTTAIKRLGITDPSAIRRLRDKLNEPTTADAPAQPLKATAPELKMTSPPLKPAHSEAPAAAAPVAPPPLAEKPSPADARAREEQALLAAYLKAMMQSAPPQPVAPEQTAAKPEPPKPEPPKAEQPKPQQQPPQPQAQAPFSFPPMGMGMPGFPPMPPFPGLPQMPMAPMGAGFNIPGMPSFLQPFQQPGQPPAPGSAQARQLEALKLAMEATTAVARFQLHMVENAAAYSPMAMMLQGQSFIGQMMTAALTGQLDAMRRQMMGEKK